MRLLERCGKCLTAKEPPLVLVTLGRGMELDYETMVGPRRWDAEIVVSEPTRACWLTEWRLEDSLGKPHRIILLVVAL